MSFPQPLSPELEAKARELVARLRPQAEEDLLALARLLVSKDDRELFGETEFEVRAIVHRLGAKAYTAHLAGKKRLRRLRRRLPALRAKREVPRLPRQSSPESVGPRGLPACVLLLRLLWPGRVAVG